MRIKSLFCLDGKTEKFITIKEPNIIGTFKTGVLIKHPYEDSHYYVNKGLLICERVGGSMDILREIVKRNIQPLDYTGKYRMNRHVKRINLSRRVR